MKRIPIAVLLFLLMSTAAFVSAAPGRSMQTATATLRTLNDSGISGHLTIRDDGSVLSISGTAEGLDPNGFYFSLLYDIDSVATGLFACEPAFGIGVATEDAPGRLTIDEMGAVNFVTLLLIWNVSPNGKGQLSGTVDVDLDRVRAISIRDGNIDDGIGPLAVSACGIIVSHGG